MGRTSSGIHYYFDGTVAERPPLPANSIYYHRYLLFHPGKLPAAAPQEALICRKIKQSNTHRSGNEEIFSVANSQKMLRKCVQNFITASRVLKLKK